MNVETAKEPQERVSFQLDDDLREAVELLARKAERSLSAEIRLALRRHVERETGEAAPA